MSLSRPLARCVRWGTLAAIAGALVAIPSLARIPARSFVGCAAWIALAVLLELLAMLGFAAVFTLVFGGRSGWRQDLAAGLRALGASAVLPAGGLLGPMIAAGPTPAGNRRSIATLTRSAVAFAIITNVPGLLVLAVLGLSLWLGWPAGPHDAVQTLPAAGVALTLLVGGLLLRGSQSSPRADSRRRLGPQGRLSAGVGLARDGLGEAGRLLSAGNWKLSGALGYYVFDNAVLWAAFHAHGWSPPVSVLVMGYVVGSLGSAVPLPGGIGAVEGGLIGALVLYGAPAAPAASAVLLYRGVSALMPGAFGACAWALDPSGGGLLRARRGLSKPADRPALG
jgi:uncharacterized membrane protein YbhN (UPF0104 family)